MAARPGGHLGGAAQICALGVCVAAALGLSAMPSRSGRAQEPSGLQSLRGPLDPTPASVRSLDSADDPDDDPAAEVALLRFESGLAPAELLEGARTGEPVAFPPPAAAPRGPPGS